MTAAEHHVWRYKVSRDDAALEFLSFSYREGTPAIAARVQLGREFTEVTTPADLDPEVLDRLIESVREHFREKTVEQAFSIRHDHERID